MRVLKGILKDSLAYYERLQRNLERRLIRLPKGSVKHRRIKGRWYYYLQLRTGDKVVHRYLGRKRPLDLLKAVQERRRLLRELKLAKEALRLLPRRKLEA
jgi:hypothetical protein